MHSFQSYLQMEERPVNMVPHTQNLCPDLHVRKKEKESADWTVKLSSTEPRC